MMIMICTLPYSFQLRKTMLQPQRKKLWILQQKKRWHISILLIIRHAYPFALGWHTLLPSVVAGCFILMSCTSEGSSH
uniref:Uncharacterized protein n=1 Tax=Arundo donax TaxID=35708 RepID=A0A0A9C156_ARUDO